MRNIAARGLFINDYRTGARSTSNERTGRKPVTIQDPVSHARNHGKRKSHKDVMDFYLNNIYGELLDNDEVPDDDDEILRQDNF